jgi:Fur family peroxide stress response transcriptional regulator
MDAAPGHHHPPTPDEVRSLFRDRGLRCTRQRELIYAALAATHTHPTAEELFHTVRGDEPGLSLATIYNTLEVFTDRGLCRRLPSASGNGPCRFDADTDQHAHIVLGDGRIVDIPADLVKGLSDSISPRIRAELEARLGIRITGVHIQLEARAAETGRVLP